MAAKLSSCSHIEYRCTFWINMTTKPRDSRYIIGDNIRILREESGRSIAELCSPMGWSRAYWNDLERGFKTPSVQRMQEIAEVLSEVTGREVTIRDLLTEPRARRRELVRSK